MAKYGFNLVLVSRSEYKLQNVREECLKLNPQIDVQVVPLDFSKAESADYDKVFSRFKKIAEDEKVSDHHPMNLRILINNVGLNDQKKFFELTPEEIQGLLMVNMFTQVFMTKHAREVMPKDKKNAFIHVSSVIGDIDLPFHGVYSGTKTFNRVFGKLTSENHRTNKAETLILKPAGITTGMTQNYKDPSFVDPEDVTFGMLRELGTSQGYHESNGAFLHSLQGAGINYIPQFIAHPLKLQISTLKDSPYK